MKDLFLLLGHDDSFLRKHIGTEFSYNFSPTGRATLKKVSSCGFKGMFISSCGTVERWEDYGTCINIID
jgi:hypothetical protein